LENFLQIAAASPRHDDPMVRAAVSRVTEYLRDRLASGDPSGQEPSTSVHQGLSSP
jgi:hypothetical protein